MCLSETLLKTCDLKISLKPRNRKSDKIRKQYFISIVTHKCISLCKFVLYTYNYEKNLFSVTKGILHFVLDFKSTGK